MSLNTTNSLSLQKKIYFSFNFFFNNKALSKLAEVRDLGILIDSKLSFSTYIDSIDKRSWKMREDTSITTLLHTTDSFFLI